MVHKMKNAVILLFGGYVIDCEVYFMEEMKIILESSIWLAPRRKTEVASVHLLNLVPKIKL